MYLFQLSGLVKSENIRYICELLYGIIQVPICFLNRDGEPSFEFRPEQARRAGLDIKELFRRLPRDGTDDFPVFVTTEYMEIFFAIKVTKDEENLGTLIVGPSIPAEIDGEAINALSRDYEFPFGKKAELINYYHSLQVMDYSKLVNISILLYYLVRGKKLDSASVIEKNALPEKPNQKIEDAIDSGLTENRRYSMFHYAPAYEKYLLQYVKEGNKQKLLDHLNKPAGGETGKLSKNPLRNQKNLFICGTALITRAAIEGGLNSELALTISDSYIQRVEEMNEIRDVMSLHYKMLNDFTDRVHKVKELDYSKAVTLCQNYIFKHLYEKITLPQLSDISGMSCNYLSELFKKEVGIPLSEYIQKERVEEAKKLLDLTDTTIMDICISLNFSDQSYFTKIFKKFAGMTPKQYRNKNIAGDGSI